MDPTDPDRRAAFLVAGVQKGGTTALFDHLAAHPALALPEEKELHFFDDETGVDWAAPDYGAYHARWPRDRAGLRGEATPIYLYWRPSLERIARYNPDIRLILVFRDPVERAWSHWRMERARGAEDLPFGVCIREGRARVDDPASPGQHRVHSYVERGFYGAQVARLIEFFPREQVFFGTSRQLRTEPTLFLRNVCEFLGAPPFDEVSPIVSHVGRTDGEFESLPDDDRAFLELIYSKDRVLFQTLTGLEL